MNEFTIRTTPFRMLMIESKESYDTMINILGDNTDKVYTLSTPYHLLGIRRELYCSKV